MTDRVELPLSGASFGADPSFVELLRRQHPEALPSSLQMTGPWRSRRARPSSDCASRTASSWPVTASHGRLHDRGREDEEGVRRRRLLRDRDAGAAGQAVETVRLFQLELEHYEKLTGDRLSLEGKANRLAQMIRANFPLAMQGLVVVPLFGGYDVARSEGRLFYYDATGALGGRGLSGDRLGGSPRRTPEEAVEARALEEALRVAAEALIDAAEDDVATGGPDLARGIFPVVVTVTGLGATESTEEDVASAVRAVLEARA